MEQKKQIEKDFEKVIGYEPIKLVLERILDMIRKSWKEFITNLKEDLENQNLQIEHY